MRNKGQSYRYIKRGVRHLRESLLAQSKHACGALDSGYEIE